MDFYTRGNPRPPAEREINATSVTPPSVHQMILALERTLTPGSMTKSQSADSV
jgi:hypothetical protein